MPAIALVAFAMFAIAVHLFLKLRATGFRSVPERRWRRWMDHPSERRGPVGALLDFVADADRLEETTEFFRQLRTSELVQFERDLRILKVCIGAAPLLGLLGTVTGMLVTFGALASGVGGDKTMERIAGGISEALITTETGLVVALPGLFLHHHLHRTYERYKAFLAHLETVCAQAVFRRTR